MRSTILLTLLALAACSDQPAMVDGPQVIRARCAAQREAPQEARQLGEGEQASIACQPTGLTPG